MAQEDAQVRPCNAQPRHPCLEKPPEPQPTHRISLTSYFLSGALRAKEKIKAKVKAKAKAKAIIIKNLRHSRILLAGI